MLLAAFDHGSRGGHDGPPGLFFLLLLALLVGSVVWFIRRRRGGDGARATTRSALHTLQDRFARGEIDQVEYDHRRAVLTGADHIPPAGAGQAPPPPAAPVDPDEDQ